MREFFRQSHILESDYGIKVSHTVVAGTLEKLGYNFPPGTSKWNQIEHKLFCYISRNWQGQPLIDIPTVINLIGSTTMNHGLTVKCILDENEYQTGIKVSEEKFNNVDIEVIEPMPAWNYIIRGFKE